jgi:hypothetical protein
MSEGGKVSILPPLTLNPLYDKITVHSLSDAELLKRVVRGMLSSGPCLSKKPIKVDTHVLVIFIVMVDTDLVTSEFF